MDISNTINMSRIGDTSEIEIEVKEENEDVGQRPNKRFADSRGLSRDCNEHVLTIHIGNMSNTLNEFYKVQDMK